MSDVIKKFIKLEAASGIILIMAAMLYLLVTIPLTSLVARLERKMAKSR